jgi:hypothetical protein
VSGQITRGQAAYEAYFNNAGGVSLVSGAELPGWADLPAQIQQAWEAAGEAAAGLHGAPNDG